MLWDYGLWRSQSLAGSFFNQGLIFKDENEDKYILSLGFRKWCAAGYELEKRTIADEDIYGESVYSDLKFSGVVVLYDTLRAAFTLALEVKFPCPHVYSPCRTT